MTFLKWFFAYLVVYLLLVIILWVIVPVAEIRNALRKKLGFLESLEDAFALTLFALVCAVALAVAVPRVLWEVFRELNQPSAAPY